MTLQYIMIQNRGEIPLTGIRLLGLTNKSEEKIGRFGTGLKEAVALLLRLDHQFVIYSGTNKITFRKQDIGGNLGDEIMYQVNDGPMQHMNLHIGFGKRDWNDAWQAMREIVCNALDEEEVSMLHHEITGDCSGVAGCTRVYIEATFDMLSEYSALPHKILHFSKTPALWKGEHGRILQKHSRAGVQIYHKGVWIQEDKHESLFDYEISSMKLTEARTTDWYNVRLEIVKILVSASKEIIFELLSFLVAGEGKKFERDELPSFDSYSYLGIHNSAAWRGAWKARFGKAVACPPDQNIFAQLVAKNIVPIVFDRDMVKFLKRVGCPCYTNTLSETLCEKSITLVDKTTRFDEIWKSLAKAGKRKPPVLVYQSTDSNERGFYDDGKVYINESVLGSEEELLTCLEEAVHHITGALDCSLPMQEYLLKSLLKEIL